jgi:hypothetical protein
VIVLGATAGIGTAAWSADDKGGQRPANQQVTEPGDDNGGLRTPSAPGTTAAGDDNGGLRKHAEPGDDNGGQRKHVEPGDDKGRHGERSGRSGSSSDDGAGHH